MDDIYNLSKSELTNLLDHNKFPSYRADQIWRYLYKNYVIIRGNSDVGGHFSMLGGHFTMCGGHFPKTGQSFSTQSCVKRLEPQARGCWGKNDVKTM